MAYYRRFGRYSFYADWLSYQYWLDSLATVQSVPLSPPPMAAFLVARDVERLRVQLREPTASSEGAEAADGD